MRPGSTRRLEFGPPTRPHERGHFSATDELVVKRSTRTTIANCVDTGLPSSDPQKSRKRYRRALTKISRHSVNDGSGGLLQPIPAPRLIGNYLLCDFYRRDCGNRANAWNGSVWDRLTRRFGAVCAAWDIRAR